MCPSPRQTLVAAECAVNLLAVEAFAREVAEEKVHVRELHQHAPIVALLGETCFIEPPCLFISLRVEACITRALAPEPMRRTAV